jgi:hypothetical protein
MAAQPFETVTDLLPAVEKLVVDAHRRWYESRGLRDWSPPKAYHWLHYEDPDPIGRLSDGIERLASHVQVREEELVRLEKRAARVRERGR